MSDLKISQKELSQIVGILFFIGLLIFISGYFLGKKKILQEMADQHNNECFANKMYNSIVALSEDFESEPESSSIENITIQKNNNQNNYKDNSDPNIQVKTIPKEEEKSQLVIEKTNTNKAGSEKKIAYAQLCGFGTKKGADRYQQKLIDRAIEVTYVVEKTGTSKKGLTKKWYQVVTAPMDHAALIDLVEEIKKYDTLTDINIVYVKTDKA